MPKALSSGLKNRVEVWGLSDSKNELDEVDAKEVKLATLWCDIVPKSGSVSEVPDAAANYQTISHELTFRRSASRYLAAQNHIRYSSTRLEIEYVMPHFNNPDRIIAYCREEVSL